MASANQASQWPPHTDLVALGAAGTTEQYGDRNVTEVSGPAGAPIQVHAIEDSTPAVRLLLQQALEASAPKVIEVASADEDTATDRFPKDRGGRPLVP